jgi:hypothetical protein
VGVEPTKSRLATLSGFEGQPPHRERFPSAEDHRAGLRDCHPARNRDLTVIAKYAMLIAKWPVGQDVGQNGLSTGSGILKELNH